MSVNSFKHVAVCFITKCITAVMLCSWRQMHSYLEGHASAAAAYHTCIAPTAFVITRPSSAICLRGHAAGASRV